SLIFYRGQVARSMVVSLLNEKGLLLGHVVFCHISPSGNNKPYYEGGSRTSGLKFEHNQIKICCRRA
ncbi:hypothetical protein, partial [Escherichia coli]